MNQTRRSWLSKAGIALSALLFTKQKLIASPMRNSDTINSFSNSNLGAFSVSLNVKDLKASKEFYETLGFTLFGGSMEQHYLIMKTDFALIGLFQGMFEKTMLTFNPGWDMNAKKIDNYKDIREIQKRLKAKGIKLMTEADEKTSGPASLMLQDPDGNQILLDQHI